MRFDSGFTLSSLSVLVDVKNSLRIDRNLLHYLLEIIEQKYPDILRLKRDLSAVFEASRCRFVRLPIVLGAEFGS